MFSLAMLLAGRQDALHIVTNFLSKNNDEACWTKLQLALPSSPCVMLVLQLRALKSARSVSELRQLRPLGASGTAVALADSMEVLCFFIQVT